MNAHALSSDVVVIGYGSLMSGLGLLPFGPLRVRYASRLALMNARRGFAKFSQHGDRFAMVLEPIRPEQPIEARSLSADAPATDLSEALGLLVSPNDLARLCDREGYSGGAVQRLRQEAAARGTDLAAFLWSLFAEGGHDVVTYRRTLFRLVGYTSPHYVPHPVRVDGNRHAITFLAPGREGSGSDRVVPVRVRTGNEALMTVSEAWRCKPNRTQLGYFATCFLGGVHGIRVHDLLAPLATDASLSDRLRETIAAEQQQELSRFLSMTGLTHSAYWQAFGPPTLSLQRSGLDAFLRGHLAGSTHTPAPAPEA